MGKKVGKNCKITLGSDKILGMGTWSLNGIQSDQIESSEFDQEWKTYEFGMKDGGEVSFNGFFDPSDTTGQEVLRQANLTNSDITNLRLYIDSTSYFEPCQTSGYFSPSLTTGAATLPSCVNITSYEVSADKSGLMAASFKAKVSGVMVLV